MFNQVNLKAALVALLTSYETLAARTLKSEDIPSESPAAKSLRLPALFSLIDRHSLSDGRSH